MYRALCAALAVFSMPMYKKILPRLFMESTKFLKLATPQIKVSPLHPAQQEVYYDQITNTHSSHYNVGGYFVLNGELEKEKLHQVLKSLPGVFDALRLRFIATQEGPACFYEENPEEVEVKDLDFSNSESPEKQAKEWMQARFNKAFDLNGPLFEHAILSISDNEHYLFGRYHHLITDGYGFSVWSQYVAWKYSQLTGALQDAEAPEYFSYQEEATKAAEYIESESYQKDASYWKAQFSELPEPVLKKKYLRFAEERLSKTRVIEITEPQRSLIEDLVSRTGVSLQQLSLAALGIYFSRVENRRELVFGIPVHNRRNKRQRTVVGMFAGMVPYKGSYNPGQRLSEFLQEVKSRQRNGYRHQSFPISHLNRELKLMASGRSNIFDIAVNYAFLNFNMSFGKLGTKTFDMGSQSEMYPLHFWWRDYGRQQPLQLRLDYQLAYFSDEEAEQLGKHFLFILEQFPAALDKEIGEIAIVPEEEQRELIALSDQVKMPFPEDKTLVDLFEEQAAGNPDGTALVFGEEKLTYRELDQRSNQLAHYLQKRGIKEESPVPLCINRSAEMIVGLLGIMKSGGAYVPVDPDHPLERISYILEDTKASVIVGSGETQAGLSALAGSYEWVLLDKDQSKIAAEPVQKPGGKLQPENLAYIIYTSGSTGKPKGVLTEHKSVVNLVSYQSREFGIEKDEKILQVSNYAFDASIEQIFLALCNGASLVLVSKETMLDSEKLVQLIEDQGATHLHATPSFLQQLMPGKYGRLKRVIAGGEACPAELAEAWGGYVSFYNEYGPTETTVTATEYLFSPENNQEEKLVPIGRPVANTQLFVLDGNRKLLPEGAAGELYIGGVQVARGYLNLPELTAERFVSNPFSDDPESRLYKTGDLVRWLPDGNLTYLGRLDDQVKIRGYRIETGEVESALNRCKGIRQAVVVAKGDASGNARLVAYVVPEGTLDKESVISQLKDKLPEYMLPSMLAELDEIPLTSNGKVNKKALPDVDAADNISSRYVAPRNETEGKLTEMWQDLLRTGRVGVEDNFFELGGHSLLAVRLLSMLRREFKVELQIKDIFQNPAIAGLAGKIMSAGSAEILPPVVPVNRKGKLPLSFSQERLWFIDQLQGSTHYHLPAVYRLKGDLNKEALGGAFRQIVRRHEVLRTVIRQEDGKGYQQVLDADLELSFMDGHSFADEKDLNAFIKAAIMEPFDLNYDFMLRAVVVELSEQEHLLVVVLHHIASDGLSVPILAQELLRLYETGGDPELAGLEPLPVQYGDYAMWQRNYLKEVQDAQLSFWKEKLQGLETLRLPTDYSRPAVKSNAGGMQSLRLNRNLVKQLENFSGKEGSTLFMSLLSALKVLLHRYSGQEDICVGIPVGGRRLPELDPMIGFFVNSLAIRSGIDPAAGFRSLLQAVKANTLDAYEHQDVPFEKVVEALGVPRNMGISPVFQVMFSLQDTPAVPDLQTDSLIFKGEKLENTTAKFDLSFNAEVTGGEIDINVEYSKDIFTEATIERMLGHFEMLLTGLIQKPETAIGKLEIVREEEQQKLIRDFNPSAAAFPEDQSLVSLFEQKAAENGNATAVSGPEGSLTYRELNARSNQLAAYLIKKGLAKESLVPVCLSRSADLVTALLGILKAGGAYVPVDPSYPAERIRYMLEDTGASLVLSNSTYQHLSEGICDVVLLDAQAEEIAAESDQNPATNLQPSDLAYVIYTSGSTGKPKGVLVEHRGVVNLCSWHIQEYSLSRASKSTMMAGVGFDASAWEIWPVLLSGASLHIVSDGQRLETEKLLSLYEQKGITHSFVPTALVEGLADAEQPEGLALQYVMTGGDQLRTVSTAHLSWKLVNHYGPTENTVVSTAYTLKGNEEGLPPIGKPISNTRAYVLDKWGRMVPQGVAGELCVAGVQVARGYLNRGELTAEKFVQDPFSADPEARMYKTGDLARWLPDGNLEFLGRVDDQVKIRGYRIEPGEVENVLKECKGVEQAVVLARKDAAGNRRLIGYVVAEDLLDKDAVIREMKKSLPDYMIPSVLVELDAIPLTVNGKTDRKALPDVDAAASITSSYVAPRTETEEKLVAIWQDLLQQERVGVEDNFFELGGDSIITIQLVSRARKEGFHFQPRDVFEHQTIASLAGVVTEEAGIRTEQEVLTGSAGLLPIQQWFFEQGFDEPNHFNQSLLLKVDKSLTSDQLNQAFSALVAQHDVLRFIYENKDGEWQQHYGEFIDEKRKVEKVVLKETESEKLAAEITAACNEWQKSLDPGSGKLMRFVLMQTPAGESHNRLLLVIHHLAVDGVSWRILLEDLEAALQAMDSGMPVMLGSKTSSYRQWHETLQQYAATKAIRQQAYWQKVAGTDFSLPSDLNETEATETGSQQNFKLPLNSFLTQALLKEVHRAYNTEINDFLLAALAKSLSDWTGKEQVLIGLEGHGREDISPEMDISRTVGWFTNLYPVLLAPDASRSASGVIQSVKEQLRGIPDKGLGFGALRYMHPDAGVRESLKGLRLEVVFNYLGQLDNAVNGSEWFAPANESSGAATGEKNHQTTKLDVSASIVDGQLQLEWRYSSLLFKEDTIEALANAYLKELTRLIIHCQQKPGTQLTPSDYGLTGKAGYEELEDFLETELNGKPLRGQVSSVYSLSPMQEGLFFHGLYDSESPAYMEQLNCRLTNLKVEEFRQSWELLLQKHSILRSSFHQQMSVPVQCVHKAVELPFEVLDYSGLPEREQQLELAAFRKADIRKGFDFAQPPLLRLTLIRLSEEVYQMIWTHHHLLLDGWSMPVLMHELLTTYEQLKSGAEPLQQEEDRYEDFIRYLEQKDPQEAEQFWKEYLSGVEEPCLLPFVADNGNKDRDRTKGGDEYRNMELLLDDSANKELQQFCQSHHLTVNTIVQGVWSYLLSSYTGQDDAVFGVTVAGRPTELEGSETRVGLYINTIPLRSGFRAQESVKDWLLGLQEGHTHARDYAHTPLPVIQKWQGIRGDLFDTLLVFENYPMGEVLSPERGLQVDELEMEEHTNYPLSIIAKSTEQLSVIFSYNAALLQEEDVKRIKAHFALVMEQIIRQPAIKLAQLELVRDEEQQILINEFNPASVAYPQDQTLVSLFEAQAATNPAAVAVAHGGAFLTYEELNIRSNQLANYLIKKGVGEETIVPVCMERSIELVTALLGILKAGGAYVPVDPSYPEGRIRYMLQDTAAPLVLSSSAHKQLIADDSGEFLLLDSNWDQVSGESVKNPGIQLQPDKLAYVIYTSGSTGKPKGVLVEHGGVVNLCSWHIKEYGLNPLSKSTMMAGVGFDASAWEVWPVLLSGASLHIIDNEQRLDVEGLFSFFHRKGITHSFVPTAIVDQLVKLRQPENLALKYVLTGGDQLRALSTAHLSWKLVNHYGPTENTVVATAYTLTGEEGGLPPIGKPVSNTRAYVLDKTGRLVPQGVAGELCVAGVQVARGYLNRPELTSEKFVQDPFSGEPESRMYKTGDLARWLPDGNLEYLGRIDEQVKIRGYRIEPGEIENVLTQCKGVKQAVVLAKTYEAGNKQLVAYVVPDGAFDKDQITGQLKKSLPDYMVPSALVELEEIPLTRNGKVDKKALPEVDASEALSTLYIAPRNETEEKLAAVWQGLLNVDRVGVEDNFFELGGHSLLVTKMVSAVRKNFGTELQIKEVFAHPTLGGIAEKIKSDKKSGSLLPPINAVPRTQESKFPLSFSQERLWFIDQLQGSSHYHLPAVFRLKGKIDIEAFEDGFRQIVDRHEALRTVLLQEGNKAYQEVMEADRWKLNYMDSDAFLDSTGMQAYIQKTVQEPFDLGKDYMLRAVLLRISENEHLLLVVLHHIASDGWSVTVLVKELAELYEAALQGREPNLPELPVQYRDYAHWQREYLQGEVLEQQQNYWKQKLAGLETLQLPTDFVRPSVQSIRGGRIEVNFDRKLTQKLEQFSKKEGVTLYMSMLAAFKVLLYRYSGQEDICVGSPIAGRTQPAVEPLIGFFVNTLALRSRLEGNAGFRDLLKQVKETTLEAYTQQDIPFEKVVEAVGVTRDMSRSPLFQVMFAMQNTPAVPSIELEGLTFSPEELKNATTKFDLTLDITQRPEGLHMNVEYCSDLFRESTVMRMMDHYQHLLVELMEAPATGLDRIPLLSSNEKKQLIEGFNETAVDYPKDKSLVAIFEEQVAKNPDAVAVVYEGEELSYEQLNRRANQLAQYLRKKGVKEESLVPVCMDRSPLMVIGLLGVLKAGAAYVPLDPSFPQERIHYMLEDSGAELVLAGSNTAEMLAGGGERELVKLDEDWSIIAEESTSRPDAEATPSNLAYVIYTSGSTGKPKGVLIEHSSLVNFLFSMRDILEVESCASLLAVTTYSFDISYLELYLPMLVGGKVIIAPKESAADGFRLKEMLSEHSPSFMQATPATWQMLLDSGWGNNEEVTILVGGEAVREELKDSLTRISPRVWNMYGPTETTIWSSCKELKTAEKITIGKPIANTSFYILDKAGDLAPVGVAGELCIGGDGLARAYHNRPDLTAERFVPDPFSSRPGARMYRTGDLARWLPDGEVEYLSRMDDQVKIRGYRIELGEIESVLQQCDGVGRGVVVAKEDGNGNKRLIGYVVPQESYLKEAVLAHLRSKLPDYMVPAILITLSELPLTPNGKVNRKALPEPDLNELLTHQYVAPRTETEEKLAGIWQDLLKLEQVGVKDNFFELGGDSLLVVRIVSHIREEFSLEIPVNTLFKFSCIADLAEYIEAVSIDTDSVDEDDEDVEVFEL